MTDNALPVYQEWGQGSTTVFLLHGMYGAKEYWSLEAELPGLAALSSAHWDRTLPGNTETPSVPPLPENP